MNSSNHFILATAGHVDHGKSALVKALTGTDPDRLPEEKSRGITIDLGFAHLDLAAGGGGGNRFNLGIVDVPGHEDFVKNMVAGVGSIDLALFIVAADDGWMPQTEEHLQILSYQGVTRAVVALTKIDLVESDEDFVMEHVREELRNSPFAQAPIVPTSVFSGRGIEELKQTLSRVLGATPAPRDIGKPRLPVDRVFTLRGIGTVVTGTLSGGPFRRGQNVMVQPSGRATRIRSIQSHNQEVDTSLPGTRTAVNLPDMASHSDQGAKGVGRGDVVALEEFGSPSDTVDVLLEKSGRLTGKKIPSARPLKDGARVNVHHGSGHFAARISILKNRSVGPGEQVLAQLRSERPVFVFAGDHFIVRDWSEQWTLAGGTVLDPDANRRTFRKESHLKFLEARAAAPGEAAVFVLSQCKRDGAARRTGLLVKSRFSAAEIAAALEWAVAEGQAVAAGDWIADGAWWKSLRERAVEAIDQEHRLRPQHPGLPLVEVKRAVEKLLPAPELFDALIGDLCRNGFVQEGVTIRRAGHSAALPPQLQAAGAKLRAALNVKPFEPPSRKELAPDATAQQALRFLLQTGEASEVGEEVVLLTEHYARAVDLVKTHLREQGPATVSELRQILGASRRIVVPLLERLDREGITRREGDKRVLRQKP